MRNVLVALGLLVAPAVVHADISVRFTSTPVGGTYAPKHVMAAWVEKQDGTFIKTLARWANNPGNSLGIAHLDAWRAKAGTNDVDAISGATQDAHIARQIKWNLKDKAGAEVPAGQYVIKIELTDRNSSGQVGTFNVTKGGPDGNQGTGLSSGGFVNVTIDYNNATRSCGDGYVDSGEVCDPGRADSCPSVCPASTIMCLQAVVVGDATACSAQCVQQPITACAADDGCCPEGCDGTTDSDCPGGGGGGGDDDPNGGVSSCATSSSGGWMLALVGLVLLVNRRRHP